MLLLFLALTMVGGGLGYIVLIIPTLGFTTLINKPLSWWEKRLPSRIRISLSSFWNLSLIFTLVSWLIVMELGIFGYFPGQNDPDTLMTIVFSFLFSSVLLACLTFICAISGDIEKQTLK